MAEWAVVEDQSTYQDFGLLLEPGSQGRYRARGLQTSARESAIAQFTQLFSPIELANLALNVSWPRRDTRGLGRPDITPLKDFDGQPHDAVFLNELRYTPPHSVSRARAQQANGPLRNAARGLISSSFICVRI